MCQFVEIEVGVCGCQCCMLVGGMFCCGVDVFWIFDVGDVLVVCFDQILCC